jgi:UDP-N-acetylglucosamine 2-epimerase (non-hydrolysing)
MGIYLKNSMRIIAIVGTRPEIIKMQPIIKEIQNSEHELIFVHTGQHYDYRMSDIFVDELELPEPHYFLNVKPASQGAQTGEIIASCERILKNENPDILLVQGDTNSALGAAIAASKLGLSIGHVEAGCRSFDKLMPEEINRVLISDIANLHFAPTFNCKRNLLREGIVSQIFLTGHPIVDLMGQIKDRILNNDLKKLGADHKSYALVTFHRRENIANKQKINDILVALDHLAQIIPVIFPCHPHTELQIIEFAYKSYLKDLKVIQPVGYLDSLSLIKHAKFVLTDSGGIQQEAALLGTPCITLREVTEWVETVNVGVNFLTGHRSSRIIKTVQHIERDYENIVQRFNSVGNLFGKIGVSRRIIHAIEKTGMIMTKTKKDNMLQ